MSSLRAHFAVAAHVARAVVRELRRGGLRDLPKNLAESANSEMVDLQAKLVGAPLVAFDVKSGKVKARA
jgi:hypothetical protein